MPTTTTERPTPQGSSNAAAGPLWVVWAWALAVGLFAVLRVPYDDEWFSISLAVDTDLPHFWASLDDDCHPPWLALMQRGLFAVFGTRAAFNLASVAAVAAGLVLLWRSVGRTLALRPLSLAVAGLHPVFFYYAGAARWYPFVFLASALRISALFAKAPGSKGARSRFLSGCLLGPMAGYADIAFAVSDTVFYLAGTRSFARRRSAVGFALLILLVVALPVLLSPLQHLADISQMEPFSWQSRGALLSLFSWIGLGLVGEAHPPWPWIALAAWTAAVMLIGLVRVVVAAEHRLFACWLVASAALWMLFSLTQSISHPRYSLLLWWLATACALELALRSRGRLRLALLGGLSYLAVGLGLALAGHGFLKADLNEFDEQICDTFQRAPRVDLVVVPYQRTAELLRRNCHVLNEVLTIPSVRHFPEPNEQLAELEARLPRTPTLLIVEDPVVRSSLRVTNARVVAALDATCERVNVERVGALPFSGLKQRLSPATRQLRLSLARYICSPKYRCPPNGGAINGMKNLVLTPGKQQR